MSNCLGDAIDKLPEKDINIVMEDADTKVKRNNLGNEETIGHNGFDRAVLWKSMKQNVSKICTKERVEDPA